MPQILTAPPIAEPLSLAETKSHLRISHSDDDTYISTLINSARQNVELRYDLCLMAQSWSVFCDRWPEDGIFHLPLYPISSIVDLKIYGDDDIAATIDPAHYMLDVASRPSRLVLRRGRSFPQPGRRVNGLEIKIIAGFAAVPAVIKQALLIIIADFFASRGDVVGGDLPLAARELLAPYRRVRLT
jgi:uncharacterized phiE125 gp8 family phage protein